LYTPQRLFGEVGSSTDVLGHEPFLERARLQREQEHDGSARLALAAYVVARLVDRLLTLDLDPGGMQSFHWQLEAVRRHLSELAANAPETAHLLGVVQAIPQDGQRTPGLWMSLTAYAYFLEHEARLEESLEMLTLAARAQGSDTTPSDFTAYALFAARLNRQLARWDGAKEFYAAAEECAARLGEPMSMLRGRLGRGAVHRGQGNYPEAREIAESVLREATALGLAEAQALASSDLGVVYGALGLPLEALQAHYRAFRLTADRVEQMRTLGDLALGLRAIHAYEAARLAFQIVASSQARVLVRANALLELMDLEASVGNRVSFERYRAAVEEFQSSMSPTMLVDYNYKLGMGFAQFGQTKRAHASLSTALQLAEEHRLNAWYFKVEQALHTLANRGESTAAPVEASPLSEAPSIREIELGLREYAAAPAV
jgi:tetratricopeptide (TPR) repeat protein